jgi:GrpB-like predicted nucleotidyltransferase (UPF0157 family)
MGFERLLGANIVVEECPISTSSLMAPTLRLVPYDAAWPERFDAEAARLRSVLSDSIIAIEHVGSTAVPGLTAKPVLDICIAVPNESVADACVAPLVQLGYEYRGMHGDDDRRRYYVLDVNSTRVAHIHLYILPATAWDEHLAFRDALRADPALAAAYAAEKYRIAEQVNWDKRAYSEAKSPFVQEALRALRADKGA